MQLEYVKVCPICSKSEFIDSIICQDFTYSQKKFTIQKCTGCQLLLTNPRPNVNSLSEYYNSQVYISHTSKASNVFDAIYLKARSYTLNWKFTLISKLKSIGTLLDYGCGTGEFLLTMNSHGWKTKGVEPSKPARDKANNLGSSEHPHVFENLAEISNNKFDVITLWHVLEHISDPNELLLKLKRKLNDDGLMFVAVPNYKSFDARHYRQYWAAYDVPRHLWHFSKDNMEAILLKNNLILDKVVPMKLDAYYVSLLSEKYKNGNTYSLLSPIKALVNAWRSNAKAKSGNTHSSHIYIARHA